MRPVKNGGLNPNRAKRETNSAPSGGGPAKGAIMGSGAPRAVPTKNAMSHSDGCCAKAGGHIMGKGGY